MTDHAVEREMGDSPDEGRDDSGRRRGRRVGLRRGEVVSPLEFFFDLVFVLAITQCSVLMSAHPSWSGIGRGLLVLGLLWWAWVGYAWLTSVVDPDRGAVRLVVFAAMAALLVTSLCVPDAYGSLGLTLALAYGAVRVADIALFVLASRDDEGLRHSVLGLAISTGVGVALLVAGALVDGTARSVVWALALALDMAGPLLIDTQGWRLIPGHFAERHGLIVIVALGESVVAIGVGAEAGVDAGVITAAVLGVAVASVFWWTYFDVTVGMAADRLAEITPVKARNEMARDAFSYLHLPLIAAIVLVAFGLKNTLADVGEPLDWDEATALVGGAALYLLGHVAFKLRVRRVVSVQRLVAAVVLVAFLPAAHAVDAVVAVAVVAAVLWAMVVFELIRYPAAHAAQGHLVAGDTDTRES